MVTQYDVCSYLTGSQNWQRAFQMRKKHFCSCMRQLVSRSSLKKQLKIYNELNVTSFHHLYSKDCRQHEELNVKIAKHSSLLHKYLKCRYQEGG